MIWKVDVRGIEQWGKEGDLREGRRGARLNEIIKVLDVSRGVFLNYLHGLRKLPGKVISRVLRHLEERKFHKLV